MKYITKISGVTFENRQNVIKKLKIGDKISLEKDINNFFDVYAIKIMFKNEMLGYIEKKHSEFFNKIFNRIKDVKVENILRGEKGIIGVRICIFIITLNCRKCGREYIKKENALKCCEKDKINNWR